MKGTCEYCKKEKELEKHHIIPKSLGGSDNIENIKLLCGICHGKAHSANFKDNRKGLIAKGIERRKLNDAKAMFWFDKNEKYITETLDNLYDENQYLWEFIVSGMNLGVVGIPNIYDLFHNGKTNIKGTLRGEIKFKL